MTAATVVFLPVPDAAATASDAVAADESSQLRYRIDEEVPRGTRVGNLVDDAGLRAEYPADVLQRVIRFRFLSDAASALFDIGATTGVITTSGDIDRDAAAVCRQRELCEIAADVVLQPVQYFRVIKVTVEIVDVNDNAPRFKESQIFVPIVEAALVGSVYVIPTATDADGPAYGVQKYELDASSDKFGLQSSTKLDGALEVRLVLREKLDREAEAQYRMRLTAFDGGPATRTGTATIVVNVLDSNDNKPKFAQVRGHGVTILLAYHSSPAPLAGLFEGNVEIYHSNSRTILFNSKWRQCFFPRTAIPVPLNIRHAHSCGDWLRYYILMHGFMSLVSNKLQQRRRFRFDMLSHSIRSFNTFSLGGSGKPNCDIRVRCRVRCSSSYIYDNIFN